MSVSEILLQYVKGLDERMNSMTQALGEVKESVGDVKESMTRLEGQFDKEIALIRVEDERQNRLLAEHIAGVTTNRERLEIQREEFKIAQRANEDRFSKIEAPRKWLKRGSSYLLGAGALAGACYGIIRFWNELTTLIGG